MKGELHILSIETSGQFCSVALSRDSSIIASRKSEDKLSHNATLAPFIEEVLSDAGITVKDLSAVAVSAGPGSYTGLRVGISLAKALCFGADIPLIAVDTLQSLAISAFNELKIDGTYYANIDARRMEVYTAPFDQGGSRKGPTIPLVIESGTFDRQINNGPVVFCGSGTSKCEHLLSTAGVVCLQLEPEAGLLAGLALDALKVGNTADPASFRPEYIKPPNITAPRKVTL